MSERTLVDYVLKGMKGWWSATKHADAWTPGIADISYRVGNVNGWLELKTITALPKRAATIARFDHPLSSAQAGFLMERDGKLLVRVLSPRQYLGFDAHEIGELHRAGGWPIEELRARSAREWWLKIDWREMCEWLG